MMDDIMEMTHMPGPELSRPQWEAVPMPEHEHKGDRGVFQKGLRPDKAPVLESPKSAAAKAAIADPTKPLVPRVATVQKKSASTNPAKGGVIMRTIRQHGKSFWRTTRRTIGITKRR